MENNMEQFINSINESFVVIGSKELEWNFETFWEGYKPSDSSPYVLDNINHFEEFLWSSFINHKPSDDYKGREWIIEVLTCGWIKRTKYGEIKMNLSETFDWFVENNYEDLYLDKRMEVQ